MIKPQQHKSVGGSTAPPHHHHHHGSPSPSLLGRKKPASNKAHQMVSIGFVLGCIAGLLTGMNMYRVMARNENSVTNVANAKAAFQINKSDNNNASRSRITAATGVNTRSNDDKPLYRPQALPSSSYKTYNIVDFGAIGDNLTDNTVAFRVASRLLEEHGGGELLVPAGGVFQTTPFNLTSNVVLTVEGTIFGVGDQYKYPVVDALPSYGRCADMKGKFRRHPLVHAIDATNLTIRGKGVIDGGGWYWYPFFHNFTKAHNIGRPHLMEIRNCTDVEIYDITLKDSAFWTLHPIYSKNVHIHHTKILGPSCRNYGCANTDGIDVDSCENVLVEHNFIDVGDDHVTILAGKLRPLNGIPRSPKTRNVTVRDNTLMSGMGLSIGSSTAGGIQDVLYQNNVMTAQKRFQLGQGIHIKVRDRFGGYIRNVAWVDNVFYVAGKPGGAIVFESDYQRNKGWKSCDSTTCTEIRDIVIRNLTVHVANPGRIGCYAQRPCHNITFDNVRFMDPKARISCYNVGSGRAINTSPKQLFDPETCGVLYKHELEGGKLQHG